MAGVMDRKYTADDFDENGQLIRDSRYMISEQTAQASRARPAQPDRAAIKAELDRRAAAEAKQKQLSAIQAELQRRTTSAVESEILTNPIATGNAYIDNTDIKRLQERGVKVDPVEFAPDSKEGIMLSKARGGVDFRRSLPFLTNLRLAITPNVPTAQNDKLKKVMAEQVAQLPDGYPAIRIDAETQSWEYLRQITPEDYARGLEPKEAIGKYRWTSGASSGVGLGDLGQLMDLPEVGSLMGGVAGAVGTRNLTFFKNSKEMAGLIPVPSKWRRGLRGSAGTAGEGAAGLAGREIGNLIELAIHSAGGGTVSEDEVMNLMQSDLGKEMANVFLGRAAGRVIEGGVSLGRVAGATLQGRQVVSGPIESIYHRDLAMAQTAMDNARINKALAEAGREERVTTTLAESETLLSPQGEIKLGPSRQRTRLNEEADRRVNAGESARRYERDRQSDTTEGLRAYADQFGAGGAPSDVADINKAIRDSEQLHLVSTGYPGEGRIVTAANKNDPKMGIKFQVYNDSLALRESELPLDQQGMGLGEEMYRSFVDLAEREGRTANSDAMVSAEADAVWQKIAKDYPGMKRHPAAVLVDGSYSVRPGGIYDASTPVWSYDPAANVPKDLIENVVSGLKAANSTNGRAVLRRQPDATELGVLRRQLASNETLRTDVAAELFTNYDKNVNVGGDFSRARQQEWMDTHAGLMKTVFGPEGFTRVKNGPPDTFRNEIAGMMERASILKTAPGTILRSDVTLQLRDNGELLSQMHAMTKPERQRVWDLLKTNAPDQADALGALLREEVREHATTAVDLTGKLGSSRKTQKTFGRWLTANSSTIEDMLGQQYVKDLHMFNRAVARNTASIGSTGVKRVTNPPALMMARTIMGVMNKWQRRVTAGRRVQMQKWYGRTVDIVAEPDKLRALASLQEMQMRLGPKHEAVVAAGVRLFNLENAAEWEAMQQAATEWGAQVKADYEKERSEMTQAERVAEQRSLVRSGTVNSPEAFNQ